MLHLLADVEKIVNIIWNAATEATEGSEADSKSA